MAATTGWKVSSSRQPVCQESHTSEAFVYQIEVTAVILREPPPVRPVRGNTPSELPAMEHIAIALMLGGKEHLLLIPNQGDGVSTCLQNAAVRVRWRANDCPPRRDQVRSECCARLSLVYLTCALRDSSRQRAKTAPPARATGETIRADDPTGSLHD